MPKHLSQILQSFPKKTTKILEPLAMATPTEKKLQDRIRKAHPVQDNGEPFGNDDSFSAKDVKVFDRPANHYGHPNIDFNKVKVDNPTALKTANIPVLQQEEKKYLRDIVNEGKNQGHWIPSKRKHKNRDKEIEAYNKKQDLINKSKKKVTPERGVTNTKAPPGGFKGKKTR